MDVRFVYSLILIISMMFLCLMIPPDSKTEISGKGKHNKDGLKKSTDY